MIIRWRKTGTSIGVIIVLGLFLLWTLFPIYWAVSTSFKPNSQLFTDPPTYIPWPPTLENYKDAFSHSPLWKYLFNSIKVALLSTPLSVIIAALAAFGLSRYQFRGKEFFKFAILIVRMLPMMVVVIPLFLIFRSLNLVDNIFGLAFAYVAFNLPLSIWLLESFFSGIPQEVVEAGIVDGCTPLDVFLKIVVPMAAPGLVASSIFCLLLAWNEFGFALILTYTLKSQTLPMALASFDTGQRGVLFSALSAAGTLSMLPVLAFSVFIQKYLIAGLTAGAVKG
jgi:ABC-type glycerol-3-phosphate transport system permease component